jgi:hypothetical protein
MRTRVGAPEPDGDEPEELDVWLADGFEAENAEGWRQWRFRIAQAEEWKAEGVTEGLHAAQWSTAGVVAGTVRSWRDAGIEAPEAVRWHEFGFGLEAARAEKAKGLGPARAYAKSHRTGRAARAPARQVLQDGPLFRLALTAVSPDPVRRLLESGADRNLVHGYLQHQWFDDEATAWALQGIEAVDAYSWYELGLTAAEAGRLTLQSRTPGDVIFEWWGAGIPLGEVADWIGAGLSATEAVEQRSRGITAEHAAALRALRQDDDRPQQGGRPGSALRARKGPPSRERIGPPPKDAEAARAAIVAAFGGLLSRGDSNAVASVEGGSNLGDCVAEVAMMWGATGEGVFVVTVEVVRFVNESRARVLYSVDGTGGLMLTMHDHTGEAILVDGDWKVARETFCEFMQAVGIACPPPEGA